jgi:glutathione peroxidase
MNTFIALTLAALIGGWFSFKKNPAPKMDLSSNIYDYAFTSIDGKEVKISEYKGKKILFVNVASYCGNTPQYEQLQALNVKYAGKLIILGFPCNQFGFQEPKGKDSIKEFCHKNYGVTFLLSDKIEVKGRNQHPIYHWLTDKSLNGVMDSEVKWNFQKYLIDENGHFVQMFAPKMKPNDPSVIAAIEK